MTAFASLAAALVAAALALPAAAATNPAATWRFARRLCSSRSIVEA